jgi:hypothetical protein
MARQPSRRSLKPWMVPDVSVDGPFVVTCSVRSTLAPLGRRVAATDVLLTAPIRFAKCQKVPTRIANGDHQGPLKWTQEGHPVPDGSPFVSKRPSVCRDESVMSISSTRRSFRENVRILVPISGCFIRSRGINFVAPRKQQSPSEPSHRRLWSNQNRWPRAANSESRSPFDTQPAESVRKCFPPRQRAPSSME